MAVIKFSVPQVRARVRQLVRDGYLAKESEGLYDLTQKGFAVLLADAEPRIMKPTKKPERGQ